MLSDSTSEFRPRNLGPKVTIDSVGHKIAQGLKSSYSLSKCRPSVCSYNGQVRMFPSLVIVSGVSVGQKFVASRVSLELASPAMTRASLSTTFYSVEMPLKCGPKNNKIRSSIFT